MHGFLSPETMRSNNESGNPAPDFVDLRQVLDFFRRRWRLILATACGAMVLAFVALFFVTPKYSAMAQVLLEPRKEKIFGNDQILSELSVEAANIDSQISVIQSINLLRRVVEKEKLLQDPEFGVPEPPGLLGFLLGLFNFSKDSSEDEQGGAKKPAESIPPDVMAAIIRLQKALDVQRVNRTLVLSITVTAKKRRAGDTLGKRYRRRLCPRSAERPLRRGQARVRLVCRENGFATRPSAAVRRGRGRVPQAK